MRLRHCKGVDDSRNIGMLLGHSFVSGVSDHFSQCGRHVVTATNITPQLSISDKVDEFHLVGTRGARVLQGLQAHAHDAITTIRPTFVIVDISTNDISNGVLVPCAGRALGPSPARPAGLDKQISYPNHKSIH